MSFGKQKAPTPPDPATVAAATTASNVDTATAQSKLNKTNMYGPTASGVWTVDPNAPGGYSYTESLSPGQQALQTGSEGLNAQAQGLAGKTLGAAGGVIGQPVDFSGAPGAVSSVPLPGMERAGNPTQAEMVGNATPGAMVGPAGNANTAAGAGPQEKFNMGMLPQLGRVGGAGQGVQSKLNYSSLGMLPTASDATRQRVEDSLYARQTARLDPQFQQQADVLSQQLANKGIPLGSPAHQKAMQEFYDAKEQAYSGARNDAITMGGAEQSRLINDQLGIRSQGAGEITTAGQFANTAQGQRFGQGVTQTDANNATELSRVQSMLQALGQRNTAGQQDFQNQFAVTNQGNQATQQNFENQLAGTGFNNQVGGNAYAQALAGAGARNQAVGQNTAANINAVGQRNQAAQQELQNVMANANLTNAQRQQAIQEIMLKHNIPLSDYASLVSGTAPMIPQFSNANQGAGTIAPTPTASIYQNAYQQNLAATNANNASAGMLPAAIGGLAGTALGGPFGGYLGRNLFSQPGG